MKTRHPSPSTLTDRQRASSIGALGVLLLIVLAGLALSLGRLSLSWTQLAQVFFGQAPSFWVQVVMEWRLPRLLSAILCGAALGLSGSLFQSLLRNPLGSPDVIGFDTGAWSGVLIAMIVFQANITGTMVGALLGGGATTVVILLLSYHPLYPFSPMALIITGIGIRALLLALNSALITHASLDTALSAGLWGAGSLAGIRWQNTPLPLGIMLLGCASLPFLQRERRVLTLGIDTATGLGVTPGYVRLGMISASICLMAASTALAGPIAFVALVAPHIMSRLSPSPQLRLTLAALGGALLLLSADLLAQYLWVPYQLPVGVVTASLGGFYLLGLLQYQRRSR